MWVGPGSATLESGKDEVVITEMEQGERGRVSILNVTVTSSAVGGQYTCLADNNVTAIDSASAFLTIYGKKHAQHITK